MKYYPIPFLLALIFSVRTAHAQPNWREIVSPAFLTVIEEVNDSIAWRKAESGRLRARMDDIIAEKKLDRVMIAGEGDKYMAEGMHKHFTKPPEPLQGHYDRDKRILELENLHVALYYSDKTLSRWTELLKKIRNHPDLSIHSRWARDWNALPPDQRPNASSLEACRKWVAGKLVCDVITTAPGLFQFSVPPKVGSFDPEFMEGVGPDMRSQDFAKFPIPAEAIAASYPMNGQFSFHRSESIPGVGYIVFSKNVANAFYQLAEHTLKARWTSASGNVVYSLAEFRPIQQQFFFNLPPVLEPEMIYRLELLALPKSGQTGQTKPADCWRTFRGLPPAEITVKDIPVSGEVKLTELFFRAGKYDIFQKPKNLAGTVNWTSGAIEFRTDEPLDEIEMYGLGKVPPLVTFSLQTAEFYKLRNALKSKALLYYLMVPRVQPLENVPADQLVAVEQDHTLDVVFIRQTSQGNSDYITLPDAPGTDMPMHGNYMAPFFKEVGAKDSLVTAQPVPFITAEHFKKRQGLPYPPTKCTLYVGELQQFLRVLNIHQQQIRRRMEERAKFFYHLEKRRALREKSAFSATLDDYRTSEAQNLPAEAKTVLEAQIPDSIQKDFTILVNYRFPGTKQYSASLTFKPDPK